MASLEAVAPAGMSILGGKCMGDGTHTFHNAICFIFMQNVRRI